MYGNGHASVSNMTFPSLNNWTMGLHTQKMFGDY